MDQELISYLDNRLNRHSEETSRHFDQKSEELRRHFDQKSEELRRHFDVVAEDLRGQIQTVAEGVVTVDEKLERFRQENSTEHDEIKSMIKFSYAELDRRIGHLEGRTNSLEARIARLESVRT